MEPLLHLYALLLEEYGPQGWWPLFDGRSGVPVYRLCRYAPPTSSRRRFEIGLGVVLTQNTTWESAVRALAALRGEGVLSPAGVLGMREAEMEALIRPARYPVQKTRYLRALSEFFLRRRPGLKKPPSREALLRITGIGPESADSLLLYAFGQPAFIADAYCRRIMEGLRFIPEGGGYEVVREWATARLPAKIPLLNEFHALLVEHGSRFYSRRPYGKGDPLKEIITRSGSA